MTTEKTYTVSEQKVEGQRSLYRIDKPSMPTYFTKSPHEAGMELSHLDAEDSQLVFKDIKPFDISTVMASYHANRVLRRHGKSPMGGLEKSMIDGLRGIPHSNSK